MDDECAVDTWVERAGHGVRGAVGVRARVEAAVAEYCDRVMAGSAGRRLCEPPGVATGRVRGSDLLPVRGPQTREYVRIRGGWRRLKILDLQRDVDDRAPRARGEEGVHDVELVHVLSRAARAVVRRVVCDVEDLRAGAGRPLRRRH